MPTYHYECLTAGGGCGQDWHDMKPVSSRYQVMCPNCTTDGSETFYDPETHRQRNKVALIFDKAPGFIHDIDFQDGRLGERVAMPSLGPNVTVGSRRELKDALERARDQFFDATNGEHSRMIPIEQPDGSFVLEKETVVKNGVDLGRIEPIEKLPEIINDPIDQETGKRYREIEATLRRRLGEVSEVTEPKIYAQRAATPDPKTELPPPKRGPGRPRTKPK